MKALTYQAAVTALNQRVIMPNRAPALTVMQNALARLEVTPPQDLKRSIVVAGTNGKGTTCKVLDTLLRSAGQRVGLYTSPHLVKVNERIQINGENISDDEFSQLFCWVDERTRDLPLSHFETLTAMAAAAFWRTQRVDYAIWEVGMGGTWDATNALPHEVSVIAQIGFDHEYLLGRTLSEIAQNKLGIIGDNHLVVHAPPPEAVAPLYEQTRSARGGTWHVAPTASVRVQKTERWPKYIAQSPWGEFALPLPGPRAAANCALALKVFTELGFDPQSHLHTIATTDWPGRMSELPGDFACPVFVSGDHNPQGMQSLADLLQDYPYRELHLIVGIGNTRDPKALLPLLQQLPRQHIYLTETPFNGLKISEYGETLKQAEDFDSDPLALFDRVQKRATSDDLIVITGSLYLVGKFLSHFQA